ncbi:Sister chromatid cohesion-related protein [Ceratobasidium theobromae]|uniref:Sister chromatid cohesion-related protein n=1 Tax=Ceratobasidium theobromae TaxID=1582974 RepID=A0A5N5QPE5_9AGAM|nr:Sister chromatid cohesion-related protein [Ceratobasidium theobromae]
MALFEPTGLLGNSSSGSSTFLSNGLLFEPSENLGASSSLGSKHTNGQVVARDFSGKLIMLPKRKKPHTPSTTARTPRDLEGLLEVPTHRMLEKLSLATAVGGIRDQGTSKAGCGADRRGVSSMWVDRYRPKCFTDLLGDERVHRETMAWLKEWDQCVFGRRRRRPLKQDINDGPQYQDEHGRPREKILLLSGPPGLGKTTLAHIVGKQAGYGVTEINASDARTGSIVDDRIRPILESGTAMGTNKPVLMVIDEVDGATGDHASGFVNKLIQLTLDKPKAKRRGDKGGKDARPLLRPIICICNDLYAPSLSRLRPISRIIRFRKAQPVLLANRLREICLNEELRADSRALTALVTVTQGDMRACINTLQIIKSRSDSVTEGDISRATVGMKETESTVQSVWNDLFTPITAKTRKHIPGSKATDPDNYVSRLSRVIENAGTDRIAVACFEHYTTLRKGRSSWSSLFAANDWFGWYDMLSMAIRAEQEYALLPYQPYAIAAFHPLFATLGNPKYERVNNDWDHFTRTKLNEEIKLAVCNALVAGARDSDAATYMHLMAGHKAALEFLPLVNRIINPPLKPLNSQIVRTQERLVLKRLVEIMTAMELRYVQEKNEDGQSVYRLEPAIDVFVTYDGKRASDVNASRFAVRQMVAEELDAVLERRKQDATAVSSGAEQLFGGRKQKSTNGVAQEDGKAPDLKEKQPALGEKRPVDFFGRPIVPKEKSAQSTGLRKPSSSIGNVLIPNGYKIKYKFNEGNSSAVRKPVKMYHVQLAHSHPNGPQQPQVSSIMNIMETLFGRTVTPAERLRQHQRALAKAQRELDRERTKLEQQEKKLIMDIKKSAKAGQMNAAKVMAKDLVRTRRYVQKFYQMRTQLQAVGLRIQTLRSNQQMAEAMRGATRAMASMNRGLNLPQIQRIMAEFEKESATMDMKEEIMSDAVDEAMDDELEDEEEEGDKILEQVLDEIGIGVQQDLQLPPTTIGTTASQLPNQRERVAIGEGADGSASHKPPPSSGGGEGMSDEDALQARLDALKRGF